MAEEESYIRDDGLSDTLLIPDTGRYWLVYDFPTDEVARETWERLHEETKHLSSWRTRWPVEPPHTVFNVWVMGEDRDRLVEAERICREQGGRPAEPTEPDMVFSLRLRRQDQAIEAATAGSPLRKFTNRSQKGWRMDRQGKRRPR